MVSIRNRNADKITFKATFGKLICAVLIAVIVGSIYAWCVMLFTMIQNGDNKGGSYNNEEKLGVAKALLRNNVMRPQQRQQQEKPDLLHDSDQSEIMKMPYPPPPVSCSDLFSQSSQQTQEILAKHPELLPPDYDPITGKNLTFASNPNDEKYRSLALGVLDVNFGKLLVNYHANAKFSKEYGEKYHRDEIAELDFKIALHRPEVDGERWGLYNKGKYYEFLMTQHFMDIIWEERQLLQQQEQENSDVDELVILDVGMNIGWFTLLSASMGARRVISFDPLPMHHFRVCQSLKLNGWLRDDSIKKESPVVETYHVGVGATRDKLQVSYQLRQTGKATLWKGKPSNNDGNDFVHKEVAVITLDDFAKSQGWLQDNDSGLPTPQYEGKYPISLMKVDVEGYEYAVFDGADKLIHSGLVKYILGEFQFFGARDKARLAIAHTANAGYKLQFIGDWAGEAKRFRKYVKDVGGFPTDFSSENYADDIADWSLKFFDEHKRWKRANLMWARKEVDTDGVFGVMK